MDRTGEFVTFGPEGAKQRIPMQGPPPCWSCPKQPDDVPADRRKPLPMADDFGPWVWELMDWYAGGRAVGFGDDVPPLLREVAGVMLKDERAGERDAMRAAVSDGLREVLRKR